MARRRKKLATAQSDLRPRDPFRPSPRFALQISLGMHALIMLMLFRMVSEYSSEPVVPLQIIARAAVPRELATPSFVAVPLSDNDTSDELNRPAARVESLPHQSTVFAASPVAPLHQAASNARRVTVPAVLPSKSVVLPVETMAPMEDAAVTEAAAHTFTALDRTDTLRDVPLRIASRPIYGRRPQRPLGLAAIAETAGEEKRLRPASAFAHRHSGLRMPPENRTAIDRGLEFLARVQLDDGRWQFRNLRTTVDTNAELSSPRADAAATGLALLAFFGAGHDHFDGRYRRVVEDGLDYLTRTQRAQGEFFPQDGRPTGQLTQFYSHGIATLAVCEAFGMTGDQSLRGPAQHGLDFLAGVHHPEPGGWRFLPGIDADAAAIGWQLATLRSGQLAGLNVEPQTMATIRAYLLRSRERDARAPTTVTTAVGLAVELHLGESRDAGRLRPAADDLLAHPPEVGEPQDDALVLAPDNPQRDTYYWYFGSEAMYHLGGDDWSVWSQRLYPQLIQSQVADGPFEGSWNPPQPKLDAESASEGRLYVTAMNLLSLEIQNRRLPQANFTATSAAADKQPPK